MHRQQQQEPQQVKCHNYSSSLSCPCKYVPQSSLSSLTAAEYGIVSALVHRQQRQSLLNAANNKNNDNATSNTTITPLHLAAQHGHVDAVRYLLSQNNDKDHSSSNIYNSLSQSNHTCTPLHRSCFSGAIEATRILLDYFLSIDQCNTNNSSYSSFYNQFIQCDTSFCDYQTLFHKAASGGRYKMIELLLHYIKSSFQKSQMLQKEQQQMAELLFQFLLNLRDSSGRTPLQLAYDHYRRNDMDSVSRWDEVAGGSAADWHQCVQLLRPYSRNGYGGRRQLLPSQLFYYCTPISIVMAETNHSISMEKELQQLQDNNDDTSSLTSLQCKEIIAATHAKFVAATIYRGIGSGENRYMTSNDIKMDDDSNISKDDKPLSLLQSNNCNNISDNIRSSRNHTSSTTTDSTTVGSDSSKGTGRPCCNCGVNSIVLYPSSTTSTARGTMMNSNNLSTSGVSLICKKCKQSQRKRI